MADVFEGAPDARQTASEALAAETMLFRPRYRQLSESEVALHDRIKAKAAELAALFVEIDTTTREPLPSAGIQPLRHIALNRGANVTLAVRHLEDAVYRAVKALTA